ncbi:MAG TPA: serine/threonine-protein kinase [Candidatus Polarisedimenticolia bacterium]|jgi:serine/threonine-protein kinase|nr:serine/threonine-protein kinase [Candidatus Polarisedimenticolia bacterium]
MNLKKLGRFEIIREIGRGAMGRVFLADDPKIDRKVAIKTIVLPPGTSDEEARETSHRFLREAQAAGKLLHPNIVTIFDVGEEDGVSFIAMEFIEGETLEKHTRPETLLPLRRVQELIAQAAAALDHAHQNHIIHRDIKPANLMVLKGGVLKVTDFGLAKSPSANLTQAGVLLGTPSYMSPEQIQGNELDGRSDLFSLGVVLYELLTGTRPFEGDSISTIIYRVLYEDPRPPAAHNPALPPEVNGILEKALSKEPERRYATGGDMVADLVRAFSVLPQDTLSRPFPVTARQAPATRAMAQPGTTARGSRNGRDRGGRRAGRPSDAAGREDAAVRPEPGFGARHSLKIAAVVVIAGFGLVLFPRLVNRHEQAPGRVAEAGGTSGGGNLAGGTTTLAAAAGGGPGAAGMVAIDVSTIPHGGAISLDATPLAEPRVVLSLSDPKPHNIVAEAGCRRAVAEMTASDLASFKGNLVLELKPRLEEVMVASDPPGARIRLNDHDTGKMTPAVLAIDGCESRSLTLQREGYRPWTASYDADADFDAMVESLKKVKLDPVPSGTFMVKKPADYDVEIYAGDRRIGKAGETLALQEGKHALTFRNDKLFVKESAQVTIEGGRASTPLITFPAVGSLTVQAQPSNCKVFVDGVYVDVTPVLSLPIASGGHRVKVVFVPNGAEQEVNVAVSGGKDALVTVKF